MVLIKVISLDLFSFFFRVNGDSVWRKKNLYFWGGFRFSLKVVVNFNFVIYVEFFKYINLRYVYLSYI